MLSTLKSNIKDYFSNGPKAMFVCTLVVLLLIVALSGLRKTIYVFDNNKKINIVTFRSNLNKILTDNDITLGKKDKIDQSLNSKVKDKEVIRIKRAVAVDVIVDDKLVNINSAEKNVQDMLKAEKISLRKEDKISFPLESKLKKGMKIVINRVDAKVIVQYNPIDFATSYDKSDDLETGVNVVKCDGELGSEQITTEIVYEDKKEVKRTILKRELIKKPVTKIVAVGTLGVVPASRGGNKVLYKKSIQVKATAYSSGFRSTGKKPGDLGYGITFTGTSASRNPNGYSTIAVDPKVIPLGTKVYVEGYGYAIAQDTGSAIKGNIIDLFYNSESEALHWGAKNVIVYILK